MPSKNSVLNLTNLSLDGQDRVIMRFDRDGTPGTDHAQLNVTGTVSLGSAKLQLYGIGDITNMTEVVLINNDGVDPVVGTFGGTLKEGAQFQLLQNGTSVGHTVVISYVGGDGNDVVLYTLEEGRDTDGDLVRDGLDLDDDNDGISDINELAGNDAAGNFTGFGATNTLLVDSDGDGISAVSYTHLTLPTIA